MNKTKMIESKYISENPEEQSQFFEATYEFILELNESMSLEQNIESMKSKCDKTLQEGPDLSILGRGGLERDVDHQNQVFNKKKKLLFLTDNLGKYQEFLTKILKNAEYRAAVKMELEEHLFEEPGFLSKCLDTLVRMFGNTLGWSR